MVEELSPGPWGAQLCPALGTLPSHEGLRLGGTTGPSCSVGDCHWPWAWRSLAASWLSCRLSFRAVVGRPLLAGRVGEDRQCADTWSLFGNRQEVGICFSKLGGVWEGGRGNVPGKGATS